MSLHAPPHTVVESGNPTRNQRQRTKRQEIVAFYVERYQSRLLHLAASYLRDMQAAEDCVQDVFLTALHKLNPDQPEGVIYKWLVTCTSNRAKSVLRSARMRRVLLMDDHGIAERGHSAVDHYAALDESGVLAHVMQLPVKYREVVILKYYHDFAMNEISSVLHIPENTVKTRLRRGKDLLRRSLETERGAL